MVSSKVWVYNKNTSRYGVWHVSEREIEYTRHEETIDSRDSRHYRYHDPSCHGKDEYITGPLPVDFPVGWKDKHLVRGCTCDLRSIQRFIVSGTHTIITITPAHTTASNIPVLCHQVTVRATGGTRSTYNYTKKYDIGETVRTTSKVVPMYIFEGDLPPGPTCSRCEAKWQRDA